MYILVENMRTTYLNPNIDRAQILFELYEHETVFGNAKVQVNAKALLDVFY